MVNHRAGLSLERNCYRRRTKSAARNGGRPGHNFSHTYRKIVLLTFLICTFPVKIELIAKYNSRAATSSVKITITINGWTIVIVSLYNVKC